MSSRRLGVEHIGLSKGTALTLRFQGTRSLDCSEIPRRKAGSGTSRSASPSNNTMAGSPHGDPLGQIERTPRGDGLSIWHGGRQTHFARSRLVVVLFVHLS